ncbi:MAG TPA: hypothetical protein VFU74_07220 [Actinocrinis sp.]|nr:hypothetical protein [Actinocrinis sp.]
MTPAADADRQDRALDPVRARLIRRAEQDAGALIAAARAEAASTVESARVQARAILDEARAQGEALAAQQSAGLLSRSRRRARALELDAQRAVYDEVCDKISRAVGELKQTPGYPGLRAELERRACALVGPRAHMADHARGGIVAWVPGRRVDLSLTAIAERAVDGLGEEVERLWTP